MSTRFRPNMDIVLLLLRFGAKVTPSALALAKKTQTKRSAAFWKTMPKSNLHPRPHPLLRKRQVKETMNVRIVLTNA